MPFKTKSYAKLNIFLKIVGKEHDMHLIESLFVYIDLFDFVTIAPSKANGLEITGGYKKDLLDDLKSQGDIFDKSIFARTLTVFRQTFKTSGCFKVSLEKNIPIGAGLGGGSSNAATFLKFLLNFYKIEISQKHKYELAAQIGADCAFFMQDSARFISGFGEKIGPKVKIKPCRINLYYDNIKANTAEVFKAYSKSNVKFSKKLSDKEISAFTNKYLKKTDLNNLSTNYRNDLEYAFNEVIQNQQVIGLSSYDKNKFLSGSGSCYYSFVKPKNMMTNNPICVIIKNNANLIEKI
ncbi:hypothetical protein OAP83_01180 [Rickettsiales bacterium]|nr:hypothetical protein [Rickettsiales bacterium]